MKALTSIQVSYGWTAVGDIHAGDGRSLRWPVMPSGSGVYRFMLRMGDRTRYYVGETDNYRRRFGHYAKPGPTQTTNIRMNDRLVTLLHDHRGVATLEVAVNVEITCAGELVQLSKDHAVFVRRLVENAALLEVAALGGELVNGKGIPPGEFWAAG